MKKILCGVLAVTMACGLCLPILTGCGENPHLDGTFEEPAPVTGVVDCIFLANGVSQREDGNYYYDLLPTNGGQQDDVHLEIYVEPKYAVKSVTLTVKAEDGSWSESVSELEQGYLYFSDWNPENKETPTECMRYRTVSMPTLAGKSGKATVSVSNLQLEEAKYNLHTESIWDTDSDYISDGAEESPSAEVQAVLDVLTFTVTHAGGTSKTYSWAEFNQEVIGKDQSYGYGDTFKLKIQYPEGTDLKQNLGGSYFAVVCAEGSPESLSHEESKNLIGPAYDWVARPTDTEKSETWDDVSHTLISPDKDTSATFTFSANARTAEWTLKVMRGSRILFNKYDLYNTISLTYLNNPDRT